MSLAASRMRRLAGAGLGLLLAGTAACTRERVVQGECGSYNGADICTWGRLRGDAVVAFGATIPVKSVENAPTEMAMAWPPRAELVVSLPAEVRTATGYDHLNVFWEPHGHPPGPYLAPHFDIHFNNLSAAEIAKIDCADSTKPATLPAGYELPDAVLPQVGRLIGICVPGMGMHALPSAELRSTALFEKTILVGFYHQQPIFVEPMITRATLLARKSFSIDVPAIAGAPAGLKPPAAFEAVYDSTAQAYQFTFRATKS